ncbi:MAG TPA: sigma-70 family RNA polymerase sigma factor [Gaiellaceae bacterium]|nr:sigma-70 family RNA polymerase sigma factor [Gaiellaceae bacterium]
MTSAPLPEPPGKSSPGRAAARAARLFERHGRMVHALCRAMLRDPHEAEDATQQVFLSAYGALLRGVPVRDPGAWLATIARNECRARIGAGMRAPLAIGEEALRDLPLRDDVLEQRARLDALRAALAELPDRQREAVVLRYVYGLRYGEVASALGLSRPATEALLFRARRAMRVRLRPSLGAVLAVPLAVREGIAQAVPGFAESATGGTAVVAGAAGGLLAKLGTTPAAAKVATAAVAVSTVGAAGSIQADRPVRDPASASGSVTAIVDERGDAEDGQRSGRPPSRGSGVEEDEDGNPSGGPGPDGVHGREDTSGRSDPVEERDDEDGALASAPEAEEDDAQERASPLRSSSGPGAAGAGGELDEDDRSSSGPGGGAEGGSSSGRGELDAARAEEDRSGSGDGELEGSDRDDD